MKIGDKIAVFETGLLHNGREVERHLAHEGTGRITGFTPDGCIEFELKNKGGIGSAVAELPQESDWDQGYLVAIPFEK